MASQKYYVVWSGRKTGIFNSWEACKEQVHGVKGARYKSFKSLKEAEEAFAEGSAPKRESLPRTDSSYIKESISVDAACSGNPGKMEYRGVDTKTGEEIFHYGPVDNGTNNIGEFLAIVHALALLKNENKTTPIYSDSQTALSWVRNKRANTTLPKNKQTEHIWQVITRAETWLKNNSYSNQLLKWDTKQWGEIKADFGRK